METTQARRYNLTKESTKSTEVHLFINLTTHIQHNGMCSNNRNTETVQIHYGHQTMRKQHRIVAAFSGKQN